VPDPDGPEAGADDDSLDPEGPDGPDADGAWPAEAAWPAGPAAVEAAARPQTLQYPSSIVPPQLVQVLIATSLPLSAPPYGPSSRQLAYSSFGGVDGGPSHCW
jgi:hypothetical protein